jgi:hypothetical protein
MPGSRTPIAFTNDAGCVIGMRRQRTGSASESRSSAVVSKQDSGCPQWLSGHHAQTPIFLFHQRAHQPRRGESAHAATALPLRDRSTPRSHNVSDGCDVERRCRHPSSRLRTVPDGHGGRLRGVDVDAPLRSCRGPSDRADGPRSEWDQRPTTPPSSFVITMVADRGRDGVATAPLWLAGQLLVMFAGPPFSPGC